MTVIDRSTDRAHLATGGTVPVVTRRPVDAAKRLYAAITPDDGTRLTQAILRFRAAVFVAFLCALSAVAGAQLADRTAPALCLAVQGGDCAVELKTHRDGTVTVRRQFAGETPQEARVPQACLRPGPLGGERCPAWLVNWQAPAA